MLHQMVEEIPKGSMPFSMEAGKSSMIHFWVIRQFVPKSLFHAIILLCIPRYFVKKHAFSRFSELVVTTNQLTKLMCHLSFSGQNPQLEQKACSVASCFWYFWQIFLSSYLHFNNLSLAFLEINVQGASCNLFNNNEKFSQNPSGWTECERTRCFQTIFCVLCFSVFYLHSFMVLSKRRD